MSKLLTARQEEVFHFVERWINRHGIAPTHREIAAAIGVANPFGVLKHLRALELKGKIKLIEHGARGIQLVGRHDPNLIPIYGKVAAGKPIEVEGHVLKHVPVPTGLFRKDPDYFLRVEGDSMVDLLIFDGDLAGVKRAETADSGQIVVAHINTDEMSREELKNCGISNNGLTIKKLGISGHHRIQLKSANREKGYEPFTVDPEFVRIEGIFLGTVREW